MGQHPVRPADSQRPLLLAGLPRPTGPIGVPAELFIAGDCVADGYLNRPELTAERFFADPFVNLDGWPGPSLRSPGPAGEVRGFEDSAPATQPRPQRIYKTGDLAKYWPDGTIEFLGRRDHQVKVRGFRIELGEVEAMLAKHPDVERVVAGVMPGPDGEKQLVAYVVPQPETRVGASRRAKIPARPVTRLPRAGPRRSACGAAVVGERQD